MYSALKYYLKLALVLCIQYTLCNDIEYDDNGMAVFYKDSDPIEKINGETFYTDILYSTHLSVVEFYAHWYF